MTTYNSKAVGTWDKYNPHYSSLLQYQDKFGYTDRPFGKMTEPYMTTGGDKTYTSRDPEYWRRYRERRALGFPESAVTTPIKIGKSVPGFSLYNYWNHYYPSYGLGRYPRHYYYHPSYYYPFHDSRYYTSSSLWPYSRYGAYYNYRYGEDVDLYPYSNVTGRWSADLNGYTKRLGVTEVVKRVPTAFRLRTDDTVTRAASLPPSVDALGPSVPISQVHTLDLEVLPAKIDANLTRPWRGRRFLDSLGVDDILDTPVSKRIALKSLPWSEMLESGHIESPQIVLKEI